MRGLFSYHQKKRLEAYFSRAFSLENKHFLRPCVSTAMSFATMTCQCASVTVDIHFDAPEAQTCSRAFT